MFVFESKQGKDKSKALRALAVRDEWFTDNLPLGADAKEVIEQISGVWIAEFAELSGIGKRSVEHVKGFLSKQEDRARPAHGRRRESVPRQFIATGTTNDSQYLLDDENRRFWPVAIKQFNFEGLKSDVEQLWAEAAHDEAEGESITLQEDLWPAATEAQNARRIENPFEDLLSARLGGSPGWIPALSVWAILDVPIDRRPGLSKSVEQAMRALEFERKQARSDGTPFKELKKDQHY